MAKAKTTTKKNKDIRVYTDGSCLENPGPGGWAVIFALKEGIKKITGFETQTTNNKMELLAAMKGLQKAVEMGYEEIELVSDSSYVVNGISKGWIYRWAANGWKTSTGKPVKYQDFWKEILKIMTRAINGEITVNATHVKGHDGHTFNEMADKCAREQAEIAQTYYQEALLNGDENPQNITSDDVEEDA